MRPPRKILAWAALLVAVSMGACCLAETTVDVPLVRAGIGMKVSALKAGSTYQFEFYPKGSWRYDFQPTILNGQSQLVYVDADGELRMDEVTGPNFVVDMAVNQDEVTRLVLMLEHRTLPQSMALIHKWRDWFVQHGYAQDTQDQEFRILSRNSKQPISNLSDFDQAEKAFLDPDIKVVQMSVVHLKKGDVRVTIEMSNGRRFRALHYDAKSVYDNDESHARDEDAYSIYFSIHETMEARSRRDRREYPEEFLKDAKAPPKPGT